MSLVVFFETFFFFQIRRYIVGVNEQFATVRR